ncbi:MAG: hypothetical protein Q9181_003558 [Wetmoreana brouardii]
MATGTGGSSKISKQPEQTGKTYDTFNYPATPANANSLPGANANTTGGRPPQYATLTDALKSIKLEDFKEVHKKPCTRESFLTGIGAAFGIGGVRAILGGGPVFTACSWAVGAFAFSSFGMHEYCQYKRKIEKGNVRRMQEALEQRKEKKRIEQEQRLEEARKAMQQAKEEEERSSWKSWAFWKKSD